MKVFTLFVALLLAIPAIAQHEIFIDIAGIPGESKERSHKDWIDAYAYSGGLSNSVTTNTGSGSGKAKFEDYVFTICLDKSVMPLKAALAKGQRLPSVKIEFVKTVNSRIVVFSKIELTNVLVSSITEGSSSDMDKVTLNVSFNYARVKATYYTINPESGMSEGANEFKWDVAANTTF